MIEYSGTFSFFRWRGSVAPKALKWAVPCSCLVLVYDFLLKTLIPNWEEEFDHQPSATESDAIGLFTSILGFLIVFRANLAYGRFWEGITVVERACSVWLNGVSNLVAFCNSSVEKQVEVAAFQHLLTRLMSLLLSVSLSDISQMQVENFPTLNLDGIDSESLRYLHEAESQQKVVLQWVQRLVIEKERDGVLDVPAPILSRVFQEFSIGIVNFIEARKLTTVPFPFVFAQLVYIMLFLFSAVLMPLTSACYVELPKAFALTFLVVFAFMSVHYISVEIEQPFGGDSNDLPLGDINLDFKRALMTLLEARAQETPTLIKPTEEIKDHVTTCKRIALDRRLSMSRTALFTSGGSDSKADGDSEGKVERRPSGFGLGLMSSLRFLSKTSFQSATPKPRVDEARVVSMGVGQSRESDASVERLSRSSSPKGKTASSQERPWKSQSPRGKAPMSDCSSMHCAPSWPSVLEQQQQEYSDGFVRSSTLQRQQAGTSAQHGVPCLPPSQDQHYQEQHQRQRHHMRNRPSRQQRASDHFSFSSAPSFHIDSAHGSCDSCPQDGATDGKTCPGIGWANNLTQVAGTRPPMLRSDCLRSGSKDESFSMSLSGDVSGERVRSKPRPLREQI